MEGQGLDTIEPFPPPRAPRVHQWAETRQLTQKAKNRRMNRRKMKRWSSESTEYEDDYEYKPNSLSTFLDNQKLENNKRKRSSKPTPSTPTKKLSERSSDSQFPREKESLSIETQARVQPNFVGLAGVNYFKLNQDPVWTQLVSGAYMILYTRPIGTPFDPTNEDCKVFAPSYQNMIRVFHERDESPDEEYPHLRNFRKQLQGTPVNFAAYGVLESKGNRTYFSLRAPGPQHPYPYKPVVFTYKGFVQPEHKTKSFSPLDTKLYETTKQRGSSIAFGYRRTFDEEIISYDMDYRRQVFGFQFVEMEINRGTARQLVIGVKVPTTFDVSSAYMLQQRVLQTKLACDVSFGRAGPRFFALPDQVHGPRFNIPPIKPGWKLRNVDFVAFGIREKDNFNEAHVEEGLTHHEPKERPYTLSLLADFFATELAAGVESQCYRQGYRYIKTRLEAMIAENEILNPTLVL